MLPNSRNTTYAPSAEVKSLDLNDIQDAIIAHEVRLDDDEDRLDDLEAAGPAPRVHHISGLAGRPMVPDFDGVNWDFEGVVIESAAADPNNLAFPLEMVEEGETITVSVDLQHSLDYIASMYAEVYRVEADGTWEVVGTGASAATADPQNVVALASHPVVAGSSYHVRISVAPPASMTRKVMMVNVTRIRP